MSRGDPEKGAVSAHRKERESETVERKAVPLADLDGGAIQASEPARTPLYHQIYTVLRQKIVEGSLKNGALLPGEMDLAELYGVSRITAKRALDELARDGLVLRERGRGTSVSHAAQAGPMRASFEGQMEDLLAMGLETDVALLEFGYGPATLDVANALALTPGARVQHSVRLRRAQGGPFSHLTTYVPAEIGELYGEKDLASRPLLAILEECGLSVASAEQTITATLADAVTARRLETVVGAALVQVERVVLDTDGRPVEFITALYRPDRYQYRMTLNRSETGTARVWSPQRTGYRLS